MPITYKGDDGKDETVNINTPRGYYLYNKQRGNVPQGTNKTYWDNPARIARYYWLKKSLPEGQTSPDWMPSNLDQTYNYLLNKNQGKPWYMWDELDEADPIVPEVRSWQAPPEYAQMVASQFSSPGRLDWRPPEMIDVQDPAAAQQFDAQGNPLEVDAQGNPVAQYTPDELTDINNNPFGYDAATWEAMPLYKQLANYAFGTGAGQIAMGAAQAAVPGAIAGGLPGGVIAGVIGAGAAGLNSIEMKRAERMGENYTPGVAGRVMQGLDFAFRQSNNLLGFITQMGMSIENPERYGDLLDLFKNINTNWEAGQAFYASMGVKGEYSGGTVTGERIYGPEGMTGYERMMNPASKEYYEQRREELQTEGGYFLRDPMDQPGQEKIAMPAGMNPTEYGIVQAREMLKAGMTPMEVQNELFNLYGLGGQATDLIAGLALDPLNKAGDVSTGITGKIAKATGNVTLETAARMSNGPVDTLKNYSSLLRTKALPETPTNVELGKMDGFTRWLAGVDKQGTPTLLTGSGTGKWYDPRTWFGLTPKARADEYLASAATNLQLALQEADTPEGMMSITAALGNVDIQAASDLTTKLPWTQSPEGAALPMALRDFISMDDLNPASGKPVSTPGGHMLDVYHKYDWQRNLINRIAADLELDPASVMQKIATGQADAILKQEIGLLAQRMTAGDQGAQKWLKAINDQRKPLTGKVLEGMVENFQKGVAFGPEEFRAQLYAALLDHADAWAAKYFKVNPDPAFIRLSAAVKATQSAFLLGLNPGYLMNNAINNVVTMAWGGVFGLRTPEQIGKFWDGMGVTPARLRAGVGISAMGENIELGKAVRAAGTDSGMLQKWANVMQSGWRKKMQFAQNASAKTEQWSSSQAYTAGTMQAMNRLMVAGVGYDKLPPILAKQLDDITPGLSMAVESAIAGSGGNVKLLDQIWEGAERITLEQAIPDIVSDLKAQGLDIDTGGVRDVLQTSGLYDFLKNELPKAKDEAAVKSTFAIANDMLQRKLDELGRVHFSTEAERQTIKAKAEGVAGTLETFDNLHLDIQEFWMRHFIDLETVFGDAESMTTTQRDQVIRAQLDVADREWNRIRDMEAAKMAGIFRGLGGDDANVQAMEHNMLNTREVWGNFYAERRRMWDEYFNAVYKDKAERAAARAQVDQALDTLYGESLKAEEALQADTDAIFAQLFSKQFFGNGEAAAAWRKGVREIRNIMGEEMRAFRKTLRNLDPAEKHTAWGKFLKETYRPRIKELTEANLEKARSMAQIIWGEAAKTGNVQHVVRHTIAELRTKLALAGIGNDTQWNAKYKALSKYLDPSDPPFTEMDYNITPTPEWMARFDKAVGKLAETEGQPVATPKPTMPEVAQEVAAQVAARERVKWYAGQNGVQEIDGGQVRNMLRQSWLDEGFAQDQVDGVLVMMDAKMELQAKRQGKTSAQLWAEMWAGGTLELPDFGDPAFQTLFQTAPVKGTPEYIRFVQGNATLDANGDPIHLFHGTGNAVYDDFDARYDTGKNLLGRGIYLTDDAEIARTYAFSHNAAKPGLYETIVRMVKPLDLRDSNAVGRFAGEAYDLLKGETGFKYMTYDAEYYRVLTELNGILYGTFDPTQERLLKVVFQMNGQIINKIARDLDYDGIIFKGTQYTEGTGKTPNIYVVFDGEQIANVKVDTFFQSERGQSWYYSQLQRVIEQKMPNKASKEQIRGMLAGQVKADELKWTGFDEWLDEQKGSVTKQQVMDFLQENQVEVKEVVKGGGTVAYKQDTSSLEASVNGNPLGTIYFRGDGTFDVITESLPISNYPTLEAAKSKMDSIAAKRDPGTKYPGYVLPGGENYRELLITLPVKDTGKKKWQLVYPNGQKMFTPFNSEAEARSMLAEAFPEGTDLDVIQIDEPVIDAYKSPHWPEPNVLSHVRFDDRVDADGKRVLFVEEIQSDWHQAGREKGYRNENLVANPVEGKTWDRPREGLLQLYDVIDKNTGQSLGQHYTKTPDEAIRIITKDSVPSAPFSKNWEELTIKRIIRWAAENGYERVAWTTGKMQADRYNLAKQVDYVRTKKNTDGTYELTAHKDGQIIITKGSLTANDLVDTIGKDLADKIVNTPDDGTWMKWEGNDLEVGGEGMHAFYDEKIPNIVGKYIKKWGAKVGETEIQIPESFKSAGLDNDIVPAQTNTVQSFDVTPAMRESAMQGQPLFQSNAAATTFLPDGRAVFSALGTSRNITQLVHEVGHVFRRQLPASDVNGYIKYLKREYDIDVTYDAQTGRFGGEATIGADKAPWLERGATLDTGTWAEEVFARGFERYLREGRAPTANLRNLFKRMRDWMMEIYRQIKGSDIDVKMTDELRSIFDRMFTEKADARYSGKYIDDLIADYKGDKARLYRDIFQKYRTKAEAEAAAKQFEITQRPSANPYGDTVDWSVYQEALDDIQAHHELDPFAARPAEPTKEERIAELNKGTNGPRETIGERMNIPQVVANEINESIKIYAQQLQGLLPSSDSAVVTIKNSDGEAVGRMSQNPEWYVRMYERYAQTGRQLNRKSVENALQRIIDGDDTIKANDKTILSVKDAIWDFMLSELDSAKPEGINLVEQLILEPLPRDYVAQGKTREAAMQVQKWMMTNISAELDDAAWAQLVGDTDTFSKLLDYDIEADLPGDVSAQAIADVQQGNPVDVDTAARVGDKAMVLRLAHEFGIPTMTKAGKPMDKAALNIINKRQPEGQKYANLSEVPADVAEQAFRDHKAKYEVVEPEPQPVEIELQRALRDGENVPPEVLADYPDLAPAPAKATTPMAQPTWAGDKVTEYNGMTFRNGRFGDTANKWALDVDGKLSSGYFETPEAALADNAQVEARGADVQAAHESWNSVVERIKSGEITAKNASEADAKKLTGGYERVTKTQGTSLLRALGLTATEAKRVMNSSRQGGESSGGATLFYLGDVLDAYERLHTPASPAPLPELPKKAEPTFATMKSGQTTMFGAGEDTPLFSGTPMTAKQETFAPQQTGGQDALFATGEYLKNIEPKQGGDESGLFADTPTLFQSTRATATPEFKQWFGESKVVDEGGKPLRVYHGSPSKFEVFDFSKLGTNGFTEGVGFYFTDNNGIARGYDRGTGNTYEVYLSIKKPMDLTQKKITKQQLRKMFLEIHKLGEANPDEYTGLSNYGDVNYDGLQKVLDEATNLEYGAETDADMIASIINGGSVDPETMNKIVTKITGYDGIIARWENTEPASTIYVAFSPEQIKSVNNTGSFDPTNPNIYYQSTRGGKVVVEPIQPDTHGGMKIVANVYREANGQRELIGYLPEAFSTAQWQDSSSGRFHIIGLDVNNPNKWLIEFADGHLDTLDRITEPTAAVNAPVGTLDQIDPNAPVTETLLQSGSTHVKPILNALQQRMTRPDATVPQKLRGAQIDADTRQQVSAHLAKVKGQMSSAKLAAIRIGETKRDFALLNYNHRTNIDTYLTAILPYQFWGTRTMMNWAQRFIDRPAILSNYARLQMMRDRNERKGIPTRLKGKIAIPMPFMPDEFGDYLYIDPQRQIFPWENFYKPLTMLSSNKNMVEKRATQIVNEWIEAETISQDKGTVALKKKGADWERAVAQANQELADDLDKPYDIMSSLFSPAKPVTDAYYALTGQKEKIGKLPFTRLIEGLTGLAGNAIDLEGPVRKGLGIDNAENVGAFESSWQDWEIDRALSNMVGDGTITADEAITAMIDRKGEAYDTAMQRIGKERGIKQLLPGLFADLYPEGEKNQRQLAAEYSKAINAKKGGDTDALTKFFEAHPDYEARLASFKEPEQRLRNFLIGKVWDQYNTLSKIEKQAMSDGLGEMFTDAFLSSETRSYDAIDTDTLASWVKTMGGNTPDAAKGVTMPVNMPEQKTVEASEAYYSERDDRFPSIAEKLTKYYASENPVADAQIDAYFKWRNEWMAKNPDLIQYLTSEENELNGLPSDIAAYVYSYRAERDASFPDIFDVQERYFSITDSQQKKVYRAQHPELEQYWAFRKDYAANFPKAAAYILSDESLAGYIRGDTYSTSTGTEAGYATYDKPADYRAPFLTPAEIAKFEPGLIRQLYAYIYGGGTLGVGAKRELRQLKTDFGIPGDLDEFIDLYVKPAIVR